MPKRRCLKDYLKSRGGAGTAEIRSPVWDKERIPEAPEAGCYNAPGRFAARLSKRTTMKAWRMPGCRHDIGNLERYRAVQDSRRGIAH